MDVRTSFSARVGIQPAIISTIWKDFQFLRECMLTQRRQLRLRILAVEKLHHPLLRHHAPSVRLEFIVQFWCFYGGISVHKRCNKNCFVVFLRLLDYAPFLFLTLDSDSWQAGNLFNLSEALSTATFASGFFIALGMSFARWTNI